MEIAGQGPADRCPGGPLGKLSNYADAYVRIYVFVRLRMCAAGYIHTSGREKVAAAALVAGLVGMWFMLAYSYVYINCAVFPVAGALIAYAYDVAERTVAARKECCRKVETRRAYRAARASEYGA